jgi:hypothetical protein
VSGEAGGGYRYPDDEDGEASYDEDAEALAEWRAWWLPQWAAVSEGFCPTHRVPLEPVTRAPGWAGGHCARCRAFWGNEVANRNVRWTLDHEPWDRGRPVRPEWVLP